MRRFRTKLSFPVLGLAALGAACFLAVSSPAESVEVGDLMKQMGEAYSRLIETLFVKPIKEIVDTPFEEVKKDAEAIARLAKELPHTEGNENSKSFKEFSDHLLGKAQELGRSADKKSLTETASVLAGIHSACLNCHNENRF